MIADITEGLIQEYQRDGFLKIASFLDAEETAQLRHAVEIAVSERSERIPGFADGGIIGDEYYDNVFKQRVNLWRTNDAVRRFILDARIGRLAARLAQQDALRLYHDQGLFKAPWANATSWHIDCPYWAFHSRDAISLWIALEDVTMQSGALYFMPGTHRSARFDNVMIGPNVGDLFRVYPEWASIPATCVQMKAGDASFHNGLTAHAAGPNMTPGTRHAYAAIFMPDGSRFNGARNVLPQKLFDALRPGDLLSDDDFSPVVFSHDQGHH
ncbi:MAG: phytanoyl-CoA dioxygenase family protein [Proteobacteria bacterium]|nr:phytanoyl-CoA dioxygenase family protein [Pseudomonadota bacterium]